MGIERENRKCCGDNVSEAMGRKWRGDREVEMQFAGDQCLRNQRLTERLPARCLPVQNATSWCAWPGHVVPWPTMHACLAAPTARLGWHMWLYCVVMH